MYYSYMQDCVHLKACRRLSRVLKERGITISRGCNEECSAYDQIVEDCGNGTVRLEPGIRNTDSTYISEQETSFLRDPGPTERTHEPTKRQEIYENSPRRSRYLVLDPAAKCGDMRDDLALEWDALKENLSNKAYKILREAGFQTVGNVIANIPSLTRVYGVGKTTANEIRKEFGYRLML